jgi:uncharacterized protein
MSADTQRRRWPVWLTTAALLAAPSLAALEVPYLTGRVNDYAGLLSAEQRENLEVFLAELERATSAQVAVLTIPSLEGEVLEDYSLRVAQTWQLGQRDRNNGVLFLVATGDRRMRLEVGYGLEGTLPDATCRRILDGIVRPRFRAGDFPGGIEAGVKAVAGVIRGEEGALAKAEASELGQPAGVVARLIMFLVFLLVVGSFSLWALFTKGFAGWFQYLFLIPFWAVIPTLTLTPYAGVPLLLLWIVGFPILRIWLGSTPAGKAFLKANPRLASFAQAAQRMASSRGSGGFSGGGGSFGGGGASSRW